MCTRLGKSLGRWRWGLGLSTSNQSQLSARDLGSEVKEGFDVFFSENHFDESS